MSTTGKANGKPLDLVRDGLRSTRETLMGELPINLVDAVESVADELHKISVAVDHAGAGDGGAKWEMVRHHGECIKEAGQAIAEAIMELARAIEESNKT
jgi:hypothetical protein